MSQSDALASGIIAFLGIFIILALILGIYSIVVLFNLFKKAGEDGWKCLIPYYNLFVMSKIATGKPTMGIIMIALSAVGGMMTVSEDTAILASLLSMASGGIQIYVYYKLAKAFSCSDGRSVCAALFGTLALGKPAFDKTGRYDYIGPNGEFSDNTYASRVYGYGGTQNGMYGNSSQNYGGGYGYGNQNYGGSSYGSNNQSYGGNSYGSSNQSYGGNGYGSNNQNYGYSNQGSVSGNGNYYGGNNGNGEMQGISLNDMQNGMNGVSLNNSGGQSYMQNAAPSNTYSSQNYTQDPTPSNTYNRQNYMQDPAPSNTYSSQNYAQDPTPSNTYNRQNYMQDPVPSNTYSNQPSGVDLTKSQSSGGGVMKPIDIIDAQPENQNINNTTNYFQ